MNSVNQEFGFFLEYTFGGSSSFIFVGKNFLVAKTLGFGRNAINQSSATNE
jgi:hypothetical protein